MVVDTMNDDMECPIDRRTIVTVLDALCQVHFGTDYATWRNAIYRDEHPDYTITEDDGTKVAAGYCVDKWKSWIERPTLYIQGNQGYRSGLLDLIQNQISNDIKQRRDASMVEQTTTKGKEDNADVQGTNTGTDGRVQRLGAAEL